MSKLSRISDEEEHGLFQDLEVNYSKSKEAIWEEIIDGWGPEW